MGIRYVHRILILIYVGYISCQEKASLTFVIDDTLSMQDDINQVKRSADEITQIVFEEKSSQIKNMVLVTFNDPYAKVETVTTNRNEFKRIINNIYVHNPYGNWDCEEPSMNGIITGLKNSLPGSYIYVFTDASAKDYIKSVEIKNLCQKMQSQVVFVLTGYCYSPNSKDFLVYYDIATACSGLVFLVPKSDVHKVLIPLREGITGNKTLLTAVHTPANNYTDIPFVIDDQTEYAIVTASGNNVVLSVRGPPAAQERILWLYNAKSIKLTNTVPGKYVATVMGHTETSVNIIARTDFIFSHGFSKLEPKSISDTTKQPIADAKTHLSITVTDQKHTVNIKSAQILDMDERVLQTLPLKRVGNDFYTTQLFVARSQRFKVAVLGNVVRDGKEIRRIAKIPVTPQEPPVVLPDPKTPVVTISEGRQTEVMYGSTVKLTCKVSAYPAPKITWRNSHGATLVSQSAVVEPPYEYISYVTISDVIDHDSYTCYAESAGHPARDKSVVVTVKEPFDVKSAIQGTTELQYDKTGTLKCDVRSSVPIHIYWNYEEAKGKTTRLQTSDKYTISADGTQLDIKKMDLNLVGKYSCIAYVQKDPRKLVAFSTQVKIGGVARPVVTGNAEEKVSKGSNIDIKCHITGAPKPIITWQFMTKDDLNFVSIPGSDNVLHLRNVDVKDAGKYKCIANNVFGNGDHVTALTVQVPPTITSHTLVIKGVEGKDAVLRIPCLATGLPKPVISWNKGGVTITPSPKYSLEGDTLVIKDPKVSDSQKYRCEAKSDAGSVYETFEAKVLQSPKVSGKTDITVKSGESVEIICNIVNGVPRPVITWEFMAKGDTKFVSLSSSDNVLRLSSIDKKNDGRYKCIATNTVARDEHITTVNVEFAPIITKHSKAYKGLKGDVALKIPCDVIGSPQPVITWKIDGAVITPGTRYTIVDGALILKDPKNSDSKSYTCEAKNYLGSDEAKFAAEVDSNLEDYGIVSRVDVLDGTTKKLECVSADPKQPVRWFKEGIELNITTKYLTLNNVDVVKEGNYSCRVSDINGGQTYTYEVIVGYLPTFSYVQEDLVFDWSGSENDMLDCTFNARPPAKIVWTFNGKVLSEQTSSLAVSGNWGHYTCNVSNVHGSVQKSFDVTSSNCLIPRQATGHATSTMPLILTTDYTWPILDGTADYLLAHPGETLIFSCPHQAVKNSFLKFPTVNEISATCDKQNIFKVNGKPYQVLHLVCTNEVKSVMFKKEGKCLTEFSELIRVGYDIHGFLETYDVCLDTSKNLPLYARVLMSKSNRGKGPTNVGWHKYLGIGNGKEAKYTCKSSNSSCCYGKTQLVNARDFLDGPAQRSTLIDPLNTVPYWHPCEKMEDPWTSLENDIRTLLGQYYSQFTAWSGTHGLQEKDGLIIPRYLWKVVKFDEEESIAIVYVNGQSFSHGDILCKNTCPDADSVSWMRLVKNTYCCEVNEFLRAFGLRGTTVGVK